ncbi:MAG TPA: Nudix family hydrolase [Rhodanobacteraceae bacterium]|nr:Nudix family hydrolase [Rhodanobacteraceae bacterium]
MPDPRPVVHVAAGVLRDPAGRILLAQRRPGKHLAGLWEFPGGKREADETILAALARELGEEIGIRVLSARSLIAVPWDYPGKRVLLDVWEITAWSGTPHPREGQPLAWVDPAVIGEVPMPAADRPVIAALRLPELYLITPPLAPASEEVVRAGLQCALANGIRLIQLRLPGWPREAVAALARIAHRPCRTHDARLLVNGDWRLAVQLGLDGVHLPARIAADLVRRPPGLEWLAVSCHDRAELDVALRLDADFVTLSPLRSTPGHPRSPALGWSRLTELAAKFPLPIYALGGVTPTDLDAARAAGAQGIAAIRGLWPPQPPQAAPPCKRR